MELIVVVALLGLVFGVSGLAFSSQRLPRRAAWLVALQRARAQAIETGRPVHAILPQNSALLPAPLFLPDGRAIGAGADPLTGAPSAR